MNNVIIQESSTHDEGAVYDRLSVSLQGIPTEEAIRRVKDFLVTFPSFALGHNDLGILYHRNGNPTLALAHHEKAARLQPENTLLRKNLADFYAVELGWIEDAIDIYLEVVKRNPRDTDALVALGHLGAALSGSRSLEAPPEQHKLESVPVKPVFQPKPVPVKTSQELYLQAKELLQNDAPEEAFGLLKELVEQAPDNALFHNDLAVVSYQLGDTVQAQNHYEKAVELDPANGIFARNLADLYFTELNRVDDAIRIYLDLHNRAPRDIETIINLGHICSTVGRPDEAKTFYRRALEIEPWNKDAREALAGQSRSAAQQPSPPPQPIMPQQPYRSAEELQEEARQQMQQGRPEEARRLLEQVVSQNPGLAVAHNDLGVVASSLGDVTAAQTAYEQAVRLEPGNLNFTMNLADLYFVAAGRPDDAIQMYLELFRQYPRNIEVLTALGRICQAVGRPDEAKTFYRRALEIEPWNKAVRDAVQSI